MKTKVIFEYERGLLWKEGRFQRILAPGFHRIWGRRVRIDVIDIRPFPLEVTGQEILTSDGIPVKTSVSAQVEIEDLRRAVIETLDVRQLFYLEIQFAIREVIGSLAVESLLENRSDRTQRMQEILAPRAAVLGLKLHYVKLKDVILAGPVKEAYSMEFRARKEAAARLERARGESAALRNLANAARIFENNPSLLRLRTLQALGESINSTVKLDLRETQT